jgi:hypothetical protein
MPETTKTLPYIFVSRLAPSTSFYLAITQPLGLRYISGDSSSVTFGTAEPAPAPVFEIRRSDSVDSGPPQRSRSRVLFSAPSRSAVSAFYAAALRANPALSIGGGCDGDSSFLRRGQGPLTSPANSEVGGGGESEPSDSARIADPDGNIMEVVYVNPPDYPANFGGSTVRHTKSTTQEVGRILDWNLDVATSETASAALSAGGGGAATALTKRPAAADEDAYTIMRRTVTTSTVEHSDSQRRNSAGLSTGGVFGTVLGAVAVGAAVGGAITYSMMRSERERAPRQEFDAPPVFQRRTTFPEPYSDARPRYIEYERTEKYRYPEDYAFSKKYPPTSYNPPYSHAGVPRSRALEDVDDRASRRSSVYGGSRARGRSETGSTRRPLMIDDAEYRSSAGSKGPRLLMDAEHRSSAGGSKHSAHPKLLMDAERRSQAASSRHMAGLPIRQRTEPDYRSWAAGASRHEPELVEQRSSHLGASRGPPPPPPPLRAHRPPEAETYVSARSRHTDKSASTVRPLPPPAEPSRPPLAPSSSSRHSAATMMRRPSLSRAHSSASARKVPLPPSHAGSSKANWDDDLVSLAPSDSISCAGSRRSKRSSTRH